MTFKVKRDNGVVPLGNGVIPQFATISSGGLVSIDFSEPSCSDIFDSKCVIARVWKSTVLSLHL